MGLVYNPDRHTMGAQQTTRQNMANATHRKTAHYLCQNYDVILLPTFGTQDMVRKVRKDQRRRIVQINISAKLAPG